MREGEGEVCVREKQEGKEWGRGYQLSSNGI